MSVGIFLELQNYVTFVGKWDGDVIGRARRASKTNVFQKEWAT